MAGPSRRIRIATLATLAGFGGGILWMPCLLLVAHLDLSRAGVTSLVIQVGGMGAGSVAVIRSEKKFLITKELNFSDGRHRKIERYENVPFVFLVWWHGKCEEGGELMLEMRDTSHLSRTLHGKLLTGPFHSNEERRA